MIGERVEFLERLVVEQAALVESLQAMIVVFQDRIAVLEAEKAKSSKNSSKPPSRDTNEQRDERKQSRAERRAEGRKAGKQPGAAGKHLARKAEPDEIVAHVPLTCAGCGTGLDQGEVMGEIRRQVFDIPPVTVRVTEHVVAKVRCGCGHETVGEFPPEATAPTCWGANVKALAVYLTVRQHLPVARAAELMSELLGAPVSAGFIVNAQAEAGRRLEPFIAHVKEALTKAAVVHVDETSTRVSATTWWVHVASTALLTFVAAHRRRGREAIIDIGILEDFAGVLVRDGLAVYDNLDNASHAQCGAHLLRHLASVGEYAIFAAWTLAMRVVLLDAKRAAENAAANGKPKVAARTAATIRARYRAVLDEAFELLPPGKPPTRKHTGGWRQSQREAYNLAVRFRDNEPDILRVLTNTAVPFTNNQAERDLRMIKLHDKISGTFRNPTAAEHFTATRSYLQTATKHAISPIAVLRELFTTGPWLPAT